VINLAQQGSALQNVINESPQLANRQRLFDKSPLADCTTGQVVNFSVRKASLRKIPTPYSGVREWYT
jgi:hypothetical protein